MRDEHLSAGVSSIVLSSSCSQVLVTGTTAEVEFMNVVVPPLIVPHAILRWTYLCEFTNNANSKTIRARYGGQLAYGPSLPSIQTYQNGLLMWLQENNVQKVANTGSLYGTSLAPLTLSVNKSNPQPFSASIQLANAGDSFTLYGYCLELLNGIA